MGKRENPNSITMLVIPIIKINYFISYFFTSPKKNMEFIFLACGIFLKKKPQNPCDCCRNLARDTADYRFQLWGRAISSGTEAYMLQ